MMPTPLLSTDLAGLRLVHRGKVRDIYDAGDALLLVATDRISAYDHVLPDPIPWKGTVLTQLSLHWFRLLEPETKTHLITADVGAMPPEVRRHADLLRGRAMLVRRARPFPVECIVRACLTGSAWKDYVKTGAIAGIPLPPGLPRLARLDPPVFTPSTKAESGHDENIDLDTFARILGPATAAELSRRSLAVFDSCAGYARGRGIVICDTKLEWGALGNGDILLIDEVLTPDSSRFYRAADMEAAAPGTDPPSFDKQVVRDWLDRCGWDRESPPPRLPPDVIRLTTERYLEICEILTGRHPA